MPNSTPIRRYRSPVRKLASFFESSRNSWRDKCQGAKQELKSAKLRNQRLVIQRDTWRRRATEAESRLRELEPSSVGLSTLPMTSDREFLTEDIGES